MQSAKAIRKLSDVLGESLSSSHRNLLQCLLKEIPGRLWEVCCDKDKPNQCTICCRISHAMVVDSIPVVIPVCY